MIRERLVAGLRWGLLLALVVLGVYLFREYRAELKGLSWDLKASALLILTTAATF